MGLNGDNGQQRALGASGQTGPPIRPLQRLAEVRRTQGFTRKTVARRLGITVESVRQQEDPTTDMLLSELYRWQEILEVPVAELLVDSEDPLSAPVLKLTQLVRLAKTLRAILERAREEPVRRMAQMGLEQLAEIMPEVIEISPWLSVGHRRTQDEHGIAEQRGEDLRDSLDQDSADHLQRDD